MTSQNQHAAPWQRDDPADPVDDDQGTTTSADITPADTTASESGPEAVTPASREDVLADDAVTSGHAVPDDDTDSGDDTDLGESDLDDDDLDEADLDEGDLDDDTDVDVIVAEVVDETPYREPAAAELAAGLSGSAPGNGAAPGVVTVSQEWHDIQAEFVDDPRGAVKRAARAADSAVSALASSLREYQASIGTASTGTGDAADTEQLRTALRGYRIFCQNLEEFQQQLPQLESSGR